MKRVIGLCLCVFCFTACATAQKYEAKLNREIGKTSEQLMLSFGNPTQVMRRKNGDMVMIYTYRENDLIPSPDVFDSGDFVTEDDAFYDFTYGGDEIPIGDDAGNLITNYCQTRFYLKNNIVQSWQYKGNACVAM